ncbi:ATP-binding protein [Subdoligranulum variabile]|uniref:sensor histidine kinase n=1 Tax=Subdoligranulum variabile TaxID=214851 RepID=UPI00294332E9|nr:ATP-binding protein [Subdoligranulum variabile]
MTRQKQAHDLHAQMVPRWQDLLVTLLILAAGTAIGNIFWQFAFTKANIISVYVLGTLLTSLFTKSYFCGVFSSVVSVLLFNFFFTEPRLTLHAYEKGYPITIAIMLIVSIITVTLAIQNIRNIEEKERAALLAKNEQLRADLLRAISHDLRTPLTSISGNAANLLANDTKLEEDTRHQIFLDIYDDSIWLINLVENLLSITRIEDGRMNLRLSTELVGEVIEEALRHTNRQSDEHTIRMDLPDELLLARMDARLIVQVLINLVDNAVKYTPAGSTITVSARAQDGFAAISVLDNGPGIAPEIRPHVFEMFYTGEHKVADSRRSLGLGLALCKAIVDAHGGTITLADNPPHGCNFTFTVPLGEVTLHE